MRRLADLLVHREDGVRDVPPAGIEAALHAGRLLRRHARRAEAAAGRRPHLRAARRRGRRRPADRRGDHRLPVPHGRGRQRDHHQAARQRVVPPAAHPDAARPSRSPSRAGSSTAWIEETLRYDTSSQMLARSPLADVELHGVTAPQGSKLLLCLGAGQPRRPGVPRPRPLRPRTATRPSCARSLSFGGGRHFCLGATLARLEARVALHELVRAGHARSRSTTTGCVRVHSVNVRGFASLPTTVDW